MQEEKHPENLVLLGTKIHLCASPGYGHEAGNKVWSSGALRRINYGAAISEVLKRTGLVLQAQGGCQRAS